MKWTIDKLGICRVVWAVVCDLMRYAARAPLCKGSCREATEGLCGTVLQFRMHFGEKAVGNDFAVESSYFNDASAKRGQNGHCSFGRWAHREVHHYNPSVSYADSSPYTGEPLGVRHPPAFHSTKPPNSNLPCWRISASVISAIPAMFRCGICPLPPAGPG